MEPFTGALRARKENENKPAQRSNHRENEREKILEVTMRRSSYIKRNKS